MGRLCAIRKSQQAADRERRKTLRKALHGPKPKPATLEFANYVLVFTTLPAAEFSTAEVLRWYRLRWQVELVFKRMKSLAQLGHLPKHDARSSRAWLYGKLLIALLGQKLMRIGRDISPGATPTRSSLRRTRRMAEGRPRTGGPPHNFKGRPSYAADALVRASRSTAVSVYSWKWTTLPSRIFHTMTQSHDAERPVAREVKK